MKRLYLLIICFNLVSSSTSGQWTTYTVQNTQQLCGSLVTDIVQSSNGIMWFATNNGVCELDPAMGWWKNYQSTNYLNAPFVYDVFLDHNNKIWVATNGGGVSYRNNTNSWIKYTTDNGLSSDFVKGIAEDISHTMWFATYGGGISKRSGTVWTTYSVSNGLPENYFNCAFRDIANKMWFGSVNSGVVVFNGSGWQTFDIADGLASNSVHHIMQDNQGRIWLSGPAGVSVLTGSVWSTITMADGLPDNFVYKVIQDNNGYFHIATPKGAVVYDSTLVCILDTATGLAENNVACVFQDAEGNFWYGHEHEGLSCQKGSVWLYFNQNAGLRSNAVNDMVMDQNDRMWFATNYGLTTFDGTQWETFLTDHGHLPSNTINCIAFDYAQDILWVGTSNGLVSYNGTQWNVYTSADGLLSNNIISLFVDSQNKLWAGYLNNYGVSFRSQGVWTHYTIAHGLIASNIIAMTEDSSGAMWFAGYQGISRLTDHFTNFTAAEGLPCNCVTSITTDPAGNIYAGFNDYYAGGIARFDGNNWNITTYPLLHTKQISAVYADSFGDIWAGGYYNSYQKVLTYYTGSNFNYYYNWQGFENNTYIRTLYEDSHHNLWAAGSGYGVSRMDLNSLGYEKHAGSASFINLYPNPCSGLLNIEANGTYSGVMSIQIFDITGRSVIYQTFGENQMAGNRIQLDCSLLETGTYYCLLTYGNQTSMAKLMILK